MTLTCLRNTTLHGLYRSQNGFLYGAVRKVTTGTERLPTYDRPPTHDTWPLPLPTRRPEKPFDPSQSQHVFIGNLPRMPSIHDLISKIPYGPIEAIAPQPGKPYAFLKFKDPTPATAAAFIQHAKENPITLCGSNLTVQPTETTHLNNIKLSWSPRATRALFIHWQDKTASREHITCELTQAFGIVEELRFVENHEKAKFRWLHVHFLSIYAASRAKHVMSYNANWQRKVKVISYAPDRCSKSLPEAQEEKEEEKIIPTAEEDNKTVFLGNVHGSVSMSEITDVVKTGPLAHIHSRPTTSTMGQNVFISFLNAKDAIAFHAHATTNGLDVPAATASGLRMAMAITKPEKSDIYRTSLNKDNVTRVLYVEMTDASPALKLTHERVKEDFGALGPIDRMHISKPSSKISWAIIDFGDIRPAARARRILTARYPEVYGEAFFAFGVDRCAGI